MQNELAYHDVYSVAYADLKGIPIRMIREDRRVIFLLPDEPNTYQVLGEFKRGNWPGSHSEHHG